MVNDEISQHFPSSRASQVRPSFIRSRRLQATRLASRAHVFLAAEGFAVQITGETISWREKGSGIFSKWVITPVISGLTLLIPFITGVITYLLSGMSHQVPIWVYLLFTICRLCNNRLYWLYLIYNTLDSLPWFEYVQEIGGIRSLIKREAYHCAQRIYMASKNWKDKYNLNHGKLLFYLLWGCYIFILNKFK